MATLYQNKYAVSRVPAGSVYKMAHCLGKGLGLEVVLTMCHFICYRDSNSGTGTLDTAK